MPTLDSSDTAVPVPAEWQAGLDALRALPDGAAALLIGAADRGKTTFAALAAQSLAAAVGKVAVVDADIGQSEIGPPGTVGVAWAEAETPRLHDLKSEAEFFVGAFSPVGVALELAVAVGQAAAFARAKGARRILVDTTGLVAGPAARRLQVAKASLAAPALLIGLARGDEIDPLLGVLSAATGAAVAVLPMPEAVGRKSGGLRATRRLSRLSQALEGAREMALPLARVPTVGATLGAGTPLPPHLARWCRAALRLPVVHAERVGDTLALFLDGPPPRPGWDSEASPVAAHFRVKAVRALSLRAHSSLYLGLHDDAGHLLTVGRFLRLDTERSEMIVAAAPPARPERVGLVVFGRVRVGADGSPGPEVKPGDI